MSMKLIIGIAVVVIVVVIAIAAILLTKTKKGCGEVIEKLTEAGKAKAKECETLANELKQEKNLNQNLKEDHDKLVKALEESKNKVLENQVNFRFATEAKENAEEVANLYKGILDNIPQPIHAIDGDNNWTYINEAAARELKSNGIIKESKEELYGMPAAKSQLTQLKAGQSIQSGNGELMASDIKDGAGNTIGKAGIEMAKAQDDAAIAKAEAEVSRMKSICEYQDRAIEKVIMNLEKLSNGNLDMDLAMPEINQTNNEEANNAQKEAAARLKKINDNLAKSVEAINSLVKDARFMSQNAIDGDLDSRADANKHGGQFAEIVKGINATIDAIQTPVSEAITVITRMAEGDLNARMIGHYVGAYEKMKSTVNQTFADLQNHIAEISLVLSAISEGDLNQKVTSDYKGDFCEIKNSLNNILDALNSVMGDINELSEGVNVGSRRVSENSQNLSEGSMRQAKAVQELSDNMAKVATQVKANTEDARKASSLSDNVRKQAEEGNDQMQEMLKSMNEINESSKNISKIIKVIDDIAFQTNILALNAAVEAARAGVHGKGFAVVADEVRNLAAKSASAASETTALIEGSISKVNEGTKIANTTADAFSKIVTGVNETSELIEQIAKVSELQANGITQIDHGIGEVNNVVRSNSETAQASAASSEELHGQAENMKRVVSTFKMRGSNPATGISAFKTGARLEEPSEPEFYDFPMITLD